jgi:pyrroline-5-carboxylate reductase
MPRVWMIGCGNMAGAMLQRWLDTGTLAAEDVTVVRREDTPPAPGVRTLTAPPDGEPAPDILLLGVKPQMLADVAPHWAHVRPTMLVSILAGVDAATLARHFAADAIVRAMPNLPVAIGKGVVALYGGEASAEARAQAAALMQPLGLVEWIGEEGLFDVVTALAGSGPGFLYRVVDALAQGGAALGLPADQAERLAIATVEGAGLLAAQADASPAELAERVASPRGSTRAGLEVLDADGALVDLFTRTLAAATRRNSEMAEEARR